MHAAFDEAGAENGPPGAAPALDPTCEGLEVRSLCATLLYLGWLARTYGSAIETCFYFYFLLQGRLC
jgi:hypothetical protein